LFLVALSRIHLPRGRGNDCHFPKDNVCCKALCHVVHSPGVSRGVDGQVYTLASWTGWDHVDCLSALPVAVHMSERNMAWMYIRHWFSTSNSFFLYPCQMNIRIISVSRSLCGSNCGWFPIICILARWQAPHVSDTQVLVT